MEHVEASKLMVRRGAGLIEAEVDGEMVGLHIQNGTCYSFNSTAAAIWKLVEDEKTLAEICAVLSDDFEIEADECEADVRVLLDDLASDGLVVLSAA
ncbi:PqqD family protein [Sphingomonas sp. G-3-2-10]|uniref:PqqD family protein n=1 Tax=Sphingomonas sp. G-3-2-10 TaxID=2728838 RepID=UPI00146A56C3|nr:PqqD family protein [Sphingomonas sp. G-3-2-10]NML04891.1 PqqD family protein [Sphingomonas sp. G-3-2-10]